MPIMRLEVQAYYEAPLLDAGVETDEGIVTSVVESVRRELRHQLREAGSPSHRFKEQVREYGGFIIRVTILPHRLAPKGGEGGNGENP